MSGYLERYSLQTTGLHGVTESYLNCGGAVVKEEGENLFYITQKKTNYGKIILLAILFFITIPALLIRACCRSRLKDRIVEVVTLDHLRAEFKKKLQNIKGEEIQQNFDDFNRVSEILNLNGGRVFLHGMSVVNWENIKVKNTVAVQGRQDPNDYHWPVEDHRALQGAEVHYFHPDLEKMDVLITLDKTANEEATDAEARSIAQATINAVSHLEGVSLGGFTIYSEDINVSLEGKTAKEIEDALTKVIKEQVLVNNDRAIGRTLKLILNFDHGREKEVEDGITSAIKGALASTLGKDVNQVKCAKDCTSSFFAGDEGRANIKRTVQFLVDKLLRAEDISVFCHQGKDRSAAIVFALLLYLSGDSSEQSQIRVLQYLREKRTIVSDYQKPHEQVHFIQPMVAAVTEMLG